MVKSKLDGGEMTVKDLIIYLENLHEEISEKGHFNLYDHAHNRGQCELIEDLLEKLSKPPKLHQD